MRYICSKQFSMKEFWDSRYSAKDYAYGKAPNTFFKQAIDRLDKGKILLPADGEGRNAVYAAVKGWQAYACDLSEAGKQKAMVLAQENQVTIEYTIGDFGTLKYQHAYFDAAVLIFAHFPVDKKRAYHQLVDAYLRVGGTIIIEAFSKSHIHYNKRNPQVGGPKNAEMLLSKEELESYFPNYNIQLLEEVETSLHEGQFHIGKASVVRFIGKKRY